MKNISLALVVGLLFALPAARADFGVIPPYSGLYVSGGIDYLSTSDNYDSDGVIEPIVVGGQNAKLSQYGLWAEGEYGFAQDWAFRARAGMNIMSVAANRTGEQLISGVGLSDALLGLKWAMWRGFPGVTIETFTRLPLYGVKSATTEDIVPGDGSFDLGLQLHLMTRMDNIFFFISPGYVFRSSGYSPALLLDAAFEMKFGSIYARLFAKGHISSGNNLRDDSSAALHDTPGSANSYLRLSGSPTSYLVGLKLGVRLTPAYTMQLVAAQTLIGNRAPNYFTAGVAFAGRFDFYVPEVRRRAREIPLDGDPSDS